MFAVFSCFVYLFVVCFVLFVCLFKVWWRSLKSRVIADNDGHDPEHPVNEILAIRRYHVIYTIPYTVLSDAVHLSVESNIQSAWNWMTMV